MPGVELGSASYISRKVVIKEYNFCECVQAASRDSFGEYNQGAMLLQFTEVVIIALGAGARRGARCNA